MRRRVVIVVLVDSETHIIIGIINWDNFPTIEYTNFCGTNENEKCICYNKTDGVLILIRNYTKIFLFCLYFRVNLKFLV